MIQVTKRDANSNADYNDDDDYDDNDGYGWNPSREMQTQSTGRLERAPLISR